jgi:RimJ/RimL family protein N-acetyltransferase
VNARVLTEADAPAFHAVRQRALREHPHAFAVTPEEADSVEVIAERLRTNAETGRGFVMGVFDPGLVGIAGCVRELRTKTRHVALVWGVYVAPECRGGAGRRLLTALIERARQWPDLEQLTLEVVTEDAEPARALYRACGFEPTGLLRRRIRVGERYYDEEHMTLFLRRERE